MHVNKEQLACDEVAKAIFLVIDDVGLDSFGSENPSMRSPLLVD